MDMKTAVIIILVVLAIIICVLFFTMPEKLGEYSHVFVSMITGGRI